MKQLHRTDLYGWSAFDEERNIDFHSVLWVRPDGNVVVDPLPLTAHDQQHLKDLGGAAWIIITNSDHVRGAARLAELTRATLLGPQGESGAFPIPCSRWLAEGDEPVAGLTVLEMHGSKTPGELALILEETTIITGDLIRSHAGGTLCLLPDGKLKNKAQAVTSARRIAELPKVDAVLPGDGWPVFRAAKGVLQELCAQL